MAAPANALPASERSRLEVRRANWVNLWTWGFAGSYKRGMHLVLSDEPNTKPTRTDALCGVTIRLDFTPHPIEQRRPCKRCFAAADRLAVEAVPE